MLDDLTFGWRPAVLTVAAAVILPIAISLMSAVNNRLAARTMALLLLVLVGVFTPWLIGFAGIYDKWPSLTFLPVAVPLLAPPLLFFYAHSISSGALPQRRWLHLTPGGIEFLYQAISFMLPVQCKNAWAEISVPIAAPAFSLALTVSFVGYGWATHGLLRTYRSALANQRSDDARFAMRWLEKVMAAGAALAVVWTIYGAWDAMRPIGFEGLMGLHLGIAAVAVFLAIEAWRQTRTIYPVVGRLADPHPPPTSRNWAAQAELWSDRVRREGWTSEPELTLAGLAARLGTNTSYLSKALNEGLGVNFSTFVNDLRSEVVAAEIERGATASLLTLAMDAGFSSKASFNRAFRRRFGCTPQTHRAEMQRRRRS
jgi:AraC-like DNA-binding protein